MRGRLTFRYWVATAGLVTCFLVIGGAVEILSAFGENTRRIAAVQRAEATLVAGRIDHVLRSIEQSLHDTASLPWRRDMLGVEDARQEFHRLLKITPAIHEVRAYSACDELLLQVSRQNPDIVRGAESEPCLIRAGSAERLGYGSISFRNGSEPFTTLASKVRMAGASFARLETDLDLRFVGDVIRSVPETPQRNAYVLDSADHLIAHSDPGLALRRLKLGSLQHVAALRQARGSGVQVVAGIKSHDLNGEEVLASGIPLGAAPWVAFVEDPLGRAREEAWATAQRTTVLVSAGLVAAVLVSLVLARRLSRPIQDLRHGTSRIAHGDLTTRVRMKTGDELEDLAADFNLMAEQLHDHTTGLERKVEEKTAALKQAMRARALFLAAASHDLRQPLYAIALLAERLSDPKLERDAAAEAVQRQQRAIGLLRSQFEDLLDLSRLEAGEMRPVYRIVSLRELLEPEDAEYETLCESRGILWRFDIPEVRVRTDPEKLIRIVANLLSNAVRYTVKGSICLTAKVEGQAVEIAVEDSGVGISPADQERVFEEFVRLPDSTTIRDKGVGLGLAIVKRFAGLLEAKLKLESQPGRGTRVSVTIPLAEELAS